MTTTTSTPRAARPGYRRPAGPPPGAGAYPGPGFTGWPRWRRKARAAARWAASKSPPDALVTHDDLAQAALVRIWAAELPSERGETLAARRGAIDYLRASGPRRYMVRKRLEHAPRPLSQYGEPGDDGARAPEAVATDEGPGTAVAFDTLWPLLQWLHGHREVSPGQRAILADRLAHPGTTHADAGRRLGVAECQISVAMSRLRLLVDEYLHTKGRAA